MSVETFIASNRFGFGLAPDEPRQIGGDGRGYVLAQLTAPSTSPPEFAELPKGSDAVRRLQEAIKDKSLQSEEFRRAARAGYFREIGQRTKAAIRSQTPLMERLVHFWSNHFTVSIAGKPILGAIAGLYEREAIRPHVTGQFADMLRSVMRHPAMLIYLDNATSVGPNSRAGRRRDKGLNENLARELLELHTLGVDGGYTQQDVQEFAKILTGWSIGRVRSDEAGNFRFHDLIHEPGDKILLGKRYEEAGVEEGERALLELSRHPASANHIARKLVRHFIADEPLPAIVDKLARAFRDSDGDLREVTSTLVNLEEAWRDPLAKVKSPMEFVIAALRATAVEPEGEKIVQSLALLGQAPFAAPSPAGWPDDAAGWIGPEAVMRRIEWSSAFAQKLPRDLAPVDLAQATIGSVADQDTMLAIERAGDKQESLALLFASPAFQRR
jgi:uncharacterized protein (DUF1800 family)